MFFKNQFWIFACVVCSLAACQSAQLREVTVEEFAAFISATGYVTDAEKFGWSIVQDDIYNFHTLDSIDWRRPAERGAAQAQEPVTQVSYNDARAFAKWSKTTIPSYEEYWKLARPDQRAIHKNSTQLLEVGVSNVVGNVWEITQPDEQGRIRLAGGSYLCNDSSCNGTSPNRELYVDQTTGNTHIGIVIIE